MTPRYEPEAGSEAEDIAQLAYMHKFFPGSGELEPGERMAQLAGPEVADLPDGDAVDAHVTAAFPRTGR